MDHQGRVAELTTEEVIRSFPLHKGPGEPGFVTNFLGARMRASFIASLPQEGNIVEGYPIPTNCHASALEWAGVLRSALEAKDELVAVELGAGWAPWLVALAFAASARGLGKISLVGVEAAPEHYEFMRTNFRDNGLNPDEHFLYQGIASTHDGFAEFPQLEQPSQEWGAAARNLDKSRLEQAARRALRPFKALVRGGGKKPPVHRFKSYSIPRLIQPFAKVDLVHFDIQGDEFTVLRSARETLTAKVRRLVVGTHSRTIEQQILHDLAKHGWILEAEEGCRYRQDGSILHLHMDGCQVWKNPFLT